MKSNPLKDLVHSAYGGRLRLRVCGICLRGDTLLMVRHGGMAGGDLWAPPGGGLDFGRDVPSQLKMEFLEETGLEIEVGRFLFACELLQEPLHAVELFFEVRETGGSLITGHDPETTEPVICEVAFLPFRHIETLPRHSVHGLFGYVKPGTKITDLSGYYRL